MKTKNFSPREQADIGTRLEVVRKQLKLTQRQMAEQFGVSPSHWSRIEKGITGLGGSLFREVCQRLGVEGEWLRSGKGKGPKCLEDKVLVMYPRGDNPHYMPTGSIEDASGMTYDILHDEKAMKALRAWGDVTGCTEREAVIEAVRRKIAP